MKTSRDEFLAFDAEAAEEAASRAAERRAVGKTVDFRDIEIAGIVSARRATLATRNVRHFMDLGIELVESVGAPVELRNSPLTLDVRHLLS